MSYDLYWHNSDVMAFYHYRDAYLYQMEIDNKRKREENNSLAWLSGLYVQSAIASVFGKDHKFMPQIDFEELEEKQRLEDEEKLRLSKMTQEERIEEARMQNEKLVREQFEQAKAMLNK